MKFDFNRPINKIAVALLCSILWGSAFPVLKLSYNELGFSPDDTHARLVFAGMRFFLASMFLFVTLKIVIKHSLKIPSKKIFFKLFVLGIFMTLLQYFFFYNGLAHTTGAKGAVIISSDTFFVILFAHFVYHDDRMNWNKILGLAAGFAGVIIINLGREGLDFEFNPFGEGFIILAAAAGATGSIYAKRLAKDVHPFFLTAWQMFMGSILLILSGLTGLKPGTLNFTPAAWGLYIYSAFLSAAAFSLWNSLLKYHKAGEISIFRFMTPVSGAILSFIFIPGETFNVNVLSALFLVSLGIILVHYRKGLTSI